MESKNEEHWVSSIKEGKGRGEFYTPENLSRFMSMLAYEKSFGNNLSVYDPCIGGGELLIQAIRYFSSHAEVASVGGADILPDSVDLSQKRVQEAIDNLYEEYVDKPSVLITGEDFFSRHSKLESPWADVILINPPWGCRWSGFHPDDPRNVDPLPSPGHSEWAFVVGALQEMKDNGVLVAILPPGAMYRSGSEKKVRMSLVDQNLVDTVIGMPSNMFTQTTFPSIVVVLRKRRGETSVRFIQAKDEFRKDGKINVLDSVHITRIINASKSTLDIPHFARSVSPEQIKDKDYTFIPSFFIEPKAESEEIDIEEINQECKRLREKNNKVLEALDRHVEWLEGQS